MKKRLNKYIRKEYIEKHPDVKNGYKSANGTIYAEYLENVSFDKFKSSMSDEHKEMYSGGDGNELKPNQYPPKMASFSSSSRLTYLLFNKISESTPLKTDLFIDDNDEYYKIIFEGKLLTNTKSTPNLDAILLGKKSIVFIEVKCQEPYYGNNNKSNLLNVKYIDELNFYGIGYKDIIAKEGQKNGIDVGTHLSRFDLQQSIKHLFGINNFASKSRDNSEYALQYATSSKVFEKIVYDGMKKIVFVNLFYNPIHFHDNDIDKIHAQLFSEIESNDVKNIITKLTKKNGILHKVIDHDEVIWK